MSQYYMLHSKGKFTTKQTGGEWVSRHWLCSGPACSIFYTFSMWVCISCLYGLCIDPIIFTWNCLLREEYRIWVKKLSLKRWLKYLNLKAICFSYLENFLHFPAIWFQIQYHVSHSPKNSSWDFCSLYHHFPSLIQMTENCIWVWI